MSEERDLIKKRGSFKGRLTAFVTFLDSLKDKVLSSCDVSELQLRMGKMESLYEQYDEVQLRLECIADDLKVQNSERTEFESLYYKALSRAQTILNDSNKDDKSMESSQNHVSALYHIDAVTKESSVPLKGLIDKLNKDLRALESLGEPVKHWDTFLIYHVTQKIDPRTYREWEEFKGRIDKESSITFDMFMQFLRTRADLIENLERLQTNNNNSQTAGRSNPKIKSMLVNQPHNSSSIETAPKVNKSILGINNVTSHVGKTCRVKMSSLDDSFNYDLHCLVLPFITSEVPSREIKVSYFDLPSNIILADPMFYKPADIDLLIGAGLFWELLGSQRLQLGNGKPILYKTHLGWIVSGPILTNDLKCNFSKEVSYDDKSFNSCELCEYRLKKDPSVLGYSYKKVTHCCQSLVSRDLPASVDVDIAPHEPDKLLALGRYVSSDGLGFPNNLSRSSARPTERDLLSMIGKELLSLILVVIILYLH
ncbi:hypothetical protein HF086_009505 [Spodoptera exigua]|uniref:Peptidase aspartic putative domain-containing protein n=1 Tax=Spodoptera exigua TaxID=7107 RepID=A0A922SEY2_SPOEX|nr:hypothetical protein HF086_009505 [Spodoptera exigua]